MGATLDSTPHLRPVEASPFREKGKQQIQILLRDVLGIAAGQVVLSPAAYYVACHLDGATKIRDLPARMAKSGQAVDVKPEVLLSLVDQLEEAGFLLGPTFEAMKAETLAEFRADPIRQPICAGGAYPDDPAELRRFLDGFFTHPDGPGSRGAEGARSTLKGLVAPHIDLHRGGAAYAHAYRALWEGSGADLFVVFGTAHASPPHLFTLTRKSYGTPLGAVPTDVGVVDALAKALGEDELFSDELVHLGEHSVEFQIVWLQHLFGDRKIQAVPVLCSSIDHLARPDTQIASFLGALREATRGRKVCFIAGADLAHIGVRYGDPRGATPTELEGFGDDDLGTLKAFCGQDALAFALDARRNGEQRRLCGTSPMFATKLAAEASRSVLLKYQQWSDGTDSVSFCAVAME